VAFLKGLKKDPSQILVAAITGPASPYGIELIPNDQTKENIASIQHSCVENTGEYADPAVRILQWVAAFGNNGVPQTICADSLAPALSAIANTLGARLGPQCIHGTLRDADPLTPALDPECQVTDSYVNDQGETVASAVESCTQNGNTPPCWSIIDDAKICLGAKTLQVNRGSAPPPSGLSSQVSCVLCTPGFTQPGCP
jgi:hypothetical protein